MHPLLAEAGLVPLVVGHLRAAAGSGNGGGGGLEPQLLVSELGLLASLVRADPGARVALSGLRGAAALLAQLAAGTRGGAGGSSSAGGGGASATAAAGSASPAVKRLALELLEELVMTKAGLRQALASAAVAEALQQLAASEPAGSLLQQKVAALRKTMDALQAVM